jgi:transposase
MNILGIDIAKTKFDVCLMATGRNHFNTFENNQAGFAALDSWLARHAAGSVHACMEATGNWGLDVAAHLYASGATVSIVNPRQVKSFGGSELARNKTDRLDAALLARFCRAHTPAPWSPPLAHMRELRELVRRCASLKSARTQEVNRQKAGAVSPVLHASIARMLRQIDDEIAAMTAAIRDLVDQDVALRTNFTLICSIPGIGETTAALILAELPNLASFTPKGLAAFAGLSPSEHSSGARQRSVGITRIGHAALRSALYLCALSARRHNPQFTDFVARMTAAGKPKRVILIAIARKLLVLAHTVVRKQTAFMAEAPRTVPA